MSVSTCTEEKQSKAVVMKPPSGPLSIRQRGKMKKPPKTALELEEEEFTEVTVYLYIQCTSLLFSLPCPVMYMYV